MTAIKKDKQLERDPASAPRVVVVGAGFGGLAAVRRLARTGFRTTLIDRNVYATFQPLLYQVATAGLASSDIAYPARAVSRRYGAVYRHGELAGIDPAARQVLLADGTTLGYDYLVLATGVAEITADRVLLADGTAVPSDITVWAAGVAAPDAVRGWGLPQAAGGRISIGPDLRVIGHDRIFAVGD